MPLYVFKTRNLGVVVYTTGINKSTTGADASVHI